MHDELPVNKSFMTYAAKNTNWQNLKFIINGCNMILWVNDCNIMKYT